MVEMKMMMVIMMITEVIVIGRIITIRIMIIIIIIANTNPHHYCFFKNLVNTCLTIINFTVISILISNPLFCCQNYQYFPSA